MRVVRIVRPIGIAPLLALAAACSENNELDPGTFAAQLTGARNEALAGAAVAGVVFTEELGAAYTINLVDPGDETVFLTVSCPGEETPAAGSHPLGTTEGDCIAEYSRIVENPFTTIEQADAVSGTLFVRASDGETIAGTLTFTGPLLADGVQEGNLTATATFDARPIAGTASRAAASP